MRAEDIVEALQDKLPSLVDDFTNLSTVSAIGINTAWDGSTTILQITTSDIHGLTNGQAIFLEGVYSPINISSFIRSGIVGTVVSTTAHDLTKGSQATVTIQDAIEAEFNGSFALLNVTDRFTFTVLMEDSGPVSATGAIKSLDIGGVNKGIGGLRAVSSPNSTTTFLYHVSREITEVINANGTVKANARVTSAISVERFVDSYTKENTGDAWACVVLGDSVANKSRRQDIDSTDNIQRTQFFNQKFAQAADIFVVFPTTSTIAGRSVRDRCEELLQPICQCILFKEFDSLMTAGLFNPLQFTGAGFEQYKEGVYYVHRYSFEMTVQMQFEDTVGFGDDVAFRDIEMTQNFSTGTETMTTDIDLDEDA